MSALPPDEERLVGQRVNGVVVAVFHWGVIVDLGLSRVGLIDALYVDNGDSYRVGGHIEAELTSFDENKDKFLLRPPGKTPIIERLRRNGFDC